MIEFAVGFVTGAAFTFIVVVVVIVLVAGCLGDAKDQVESELG